MTARVLLRTAAVVLAAAAPALVPPTWANLREFGAWLARPILLPLAWAAHDEAARAGEPAEAFARGQQVLQLLPTWTDGHAVFAYRHVLDATERGTSPDERARSALRRLRTALAWLEDARRSAGPREIELLQAMAFLPEAAAMQEPALETVLAPDGGSAAIADRYLDAAERLRPSASIREQRTFFLPRLASGLLAAGDRPRAILVLDTAIARAADVREHDLAAEWAARLDEVRRHLRGEHGVDLGAVRADPRMAPLLPFLR